MPRLHLEGRIDLYVKRKELRHLKRSLKRALLVLTAFVVCGGPFAALKAQQTTPQHVPEGGTALYARAV
jgi:phage I-like protein